MLDKRLSALKRKFLQTRALEDELTYLRVREAYGLLSERQLKIASYCNNEAATMLLGEQIEPPPTIQHWSRWGDPQAQLLYWVQHIHEIQYEPLLASKAALMCCMKVFPFYERANDNSRVEKAFLIDLAEFISGSTDIEITHYREIWNRIFASNVEHQNVVVGMIPALCSTTRLALSIGKNPTSWTNSHLWSVASDSCGLMNRFRDYYPHLEKDYPVVRLQDVISGVIIAWAFGYEDPTEKVLNKLKQSFS